MEGVRGDEYLITIVLNKRFSQTYPPDIPTAHSVSPPQHHLRGKPMAKVLWAHNRSESSLLFCSFLPQCAYYIPLLCFPSFHKSIPKRLSHKPSPDLLCAMKVVWNAGQRAESSTAMLSSFTRASQKGIPQLELEKSGERQANRLRSSAQTPTVPLCISALPQWWLRELSGITQSRAPRHSAFFSCCLFVEPFRQDQHSQVRKENFAPGWDSFHLQNAGQGGNRKQTLRWKNKQKYSPHK